MKKMNLAAGFGMAAIVGIGFLGSVPDAYAGDKGSPIANRKITMKLDMWQNLENVSEKGGADKFWITLRSGKEIFGNILSWGKSDVHVMLLNMNDGKDDGFDMIINKNEIVAVKVQMRKY